MTRINCIPVQELSNKHLLAEYRELPRISRLARVCQDAPSSYTLGRGHMKFFYNKGEYLRKRFEEEIVPELEQRGYNLTYKSYRLHPDGLNEDWVPNKVAQKTNRERIFKRLNQSRLKKKQ